MPASSTMDVLDDRRRENAGSGLDDLDPQDPRSHVVVDAFGLECASAGAHLRDGAEVNDVPSNRTTV